jgi:hypothetical protein
VNLLFLDTLDSSNQQLTNASGILRVQWWLQRARITAKWGLDGKGFGAGKLNITHSCIGYIDIY